MTRPELAHLELLAEVDALAESLRRWADNPPDWQPARTCQALVRRLHERTETLRVRLDAPLVVATLGGTGVGKSCLVNALLGAEVVPVGRSRPTTRRPVLVCRPDVSPKLLGIPPENVEVIHRDLPALADLVLIDCPDPDTTEEPEAADSNLARLRQILPHCDVLLVSTTQQKYRSARVGQELMLAASGARLVFVQTHADADEDIRDDWRRILQPDYTTGHIFLVDSLAALADAQDDLEPRGEFAGLVDLLTRQLAGVAALRIRRANFLDLLHETLQACETRIQDHLPAVRQVQAVVEQQRSELAASLSQQLRAELLSSRRQWESRLVGRIVSCWGFSPFSMVLRIFQGLGALISGAVLFRARTPAQIALWGAVEGTRTLARRRRNRQADAGLARAATRWEPSGLRSAALVLDGYALEAGLPRKATRPETVAEEAALAGRALADDVAGEIDAVIDRAARRHTGWFTRGRYEVLLLAMVGLLLYRLAKNFFWDSWLAPQPVPMYGLELYVLAIFWLVLWCLLLVWAFSRRLRRGLKAEIDQLAENWNRPDCVAGVFGGLESHCRQIDDFHNDLQRIEQNVAGLRRRLIEPEEPLGHRREVVGSE